MQDRLYHSQFYQRGGSIVVPIIHLPYFYVTDKKQDESTSIMLQLELYFPSTYLSSANKMEQYFELIIDGMELDVQKIGSQIDCGYQYDFTAATKMNIRETGHTYPNQNKFPSAEKISYDSDKMNQFRCVASGHNEKDPRKKNAQPLRIRIEWIDKLKLLGPNNNLRIKLAIDGLKNKPVSSGDNFYPVNIDINYYIFDPQALKYQKYFTKIPHVYVID